MQHRLDLSIKQCSAHPSYPTAGFFYKNGTPPVEQTRGYLSWVDTRWNPSTSGIEAQNKAVTVIFQTCRLPSSQQLYISSVAVYMSNGPIFVSFPGTLGWPPMQNHLFSEPPNGILLLEVTPAPARQPTGGEPNPPAPSCVMLSDLLFLMPVNKSTLAYHLSCWVRKFCDFMQL